MVCIGQNCLCCCSHNGSFIAIPKVSLEDLPLDWTASGDLYLGESDIHAGLDFDNSWLNSPSVLEEWFSLSIGVRSTEASGNQSCRENLGWIMIARLL
jgi:hypothetical protein